MKKIIIFLLFFILFCRCCYSIDTLSTKYFPLKEGNFWVYNYSHYNPTMNYRVRDDVGAAVIINNHVYYPYHYFRWMYWMTDDLRVDSITGNIVKYNTNGCAWLNNEALIDSLRSRLNDSSKSYDCSSPFVHCNDTSYAVYFSQSLPAKQFLLDMYEELDFKRYAKGIGMISRSSVGQSGETFTLIGCRIDGIVYGDTSLVPVIQISKEIPLHYILFQNFPNPFNPVTKIKFSIPSPSPSKMERGSGGEVMVSLRIYDLPGREVATLVNGQLSPGTYEIEWDASNFASGIYFYKLIAGDFVDTKKMVLMK